MVLEALILRQYPSQCFSEPGAKSSFSFPHENILGGKLHYRWKLSTIGRNVKAQINRIVGAEGKNSVGVGIRKKKQ